MCQPTQDSFEVPIEEGVSLASWPTCGVGFRKNPTFCGQIYIWIGFGARSFLNEMTWIFLAISAVMEHGKERLQEKFSAEFESLVFFWWSLSSKQMLQVALWTWPGRRAKAEPDNVVRVYARMISRGVWHSMINFFLF